VDLPNVLMTDHDREVPDIVRLDVLERFYEAAARLIRGKAQRHVRIAMYGDSNLTRDQVSGYMRRWLQTRYGDAGHGFVALSRPWGNYVHMDVRHQQDGGWSTPNVTTDPLFDRRYGLSGIVAESRYPGASTMIGTAPSGAPVGTTASEFEVFFAKGPQYGKFRIVMDGEGVDTVDSHADEPGVGVHRVVTNDGPHEVRFVAADGRRRARLLGATLERSQPGFVIDSFGVGAMNSASHARQDGSTNRAMLRRRKYDLVIIATGANDPFTLDQVPRALKKVIEEHRTALPGVPILIMTPCDRGKNRTFPGTLKVVAQRRAIADEHGTAFWSLFDAVGGPNAMKSMRRRGLSRSDYIHYTEAGGKYVGHRLLHALWRGMKTYLEANPEVGCREDTTQDIYALIPE
jgi:hypothetical protein